MEVKTKLFRRDFTLVVIGQIMFLFGNAILRFALPYYLLKETGSSTLFGLVTACSFLPMVVLSMVGGILADRINKRNIMVGLDFSTAIIITLFYLSLVLGIPIGIISAIKQYSIFDMCSMAFALLGISMPVFWLGLLLTLLFSVKLGWLPSSGFNTPLHLILPAVSLGAQSVAVITRMTRSSMLEVINMDYIKTARAKGLHEKTVIIRHALGNALIPIITSAGLQFGTLLGGAVLTESIFSIPGIGRLMVDSIKMRDFPTVQGGVLIIALAFSIVNLLVDLLYAFVDPRIKAQYK